MAEDQGKSVDGLKDALVKDAQAKLDQAVKDGRLTQAQADQALNALKQHVDDLVNGKVPDRPRGFGFRQHRFDRQQDPAVFGPAA